MPRGAVIFLEDVPENHNSSCISILIKTLKWQNVGQISTQFKKFHRSLRLLSYFKGIESFPQTMIVYILQPNFVDHRCLIITMNSVRLNHLSLKY